MKKTKSATKKPKVGDIFVIPLDDDLYGFARIVNIRDGWDLAQVFDYTSTHQEPTQQLLESKMLQPPFSFNLKDIEAGKLLVISSDQEFTPTGLDSINFHMGEINNYRIIKINEYRPGNIITNDEATLYPRMEFYSLGGMIRRVKEILFDNKNRH